MHEEFSSGKQYGSESILGLRSLIVAGDYTVNRFTSTSGNTNTDTDTAVPRSVLYTQVHQFRTITRSEPKPLESVPVTVSVSSHHQESSSTMRTLAYWQSNRLLYQTSHLPAGEFFAAMLSMSALAIFSIGGCPNGTAVKACFGIRFSYQTREF